MKQTSYLCTHFHKVETWTWLRTRTYLCELLVARLQAGRECFTYHLSDFDFETLRDFMEQMDTAYLHPRRDAAHIRLCQTINGRMAISDALADKVRSSILALRGQEKKPKSIYKFA